MNKLESGLLKDASFVALVRRILTGDCSLFLGAGASLSSGGPDSQSLADSIATNVLHTDHHYPLPEIVDFADGSVGRRPVSNHIIATLGVLKPNNHLTRLAALPWKSIFTVNFDDLIEQALETNQIETQVFTNDDNLDATDLRKRTVYKLHGGIRQVKANGKGLVITQDDYIQVEAQQKALYRRLVDDIQDHEILYIGFSLRDYDFRRVVSQVHAAAENNQQLIPRGYAIMPEPDPLARHFWDTKKITLIDASLESFIAAIDQVRSGTQGVQAIPIATAPLLPKYLSAIGPNSDLAVQISSVFQFPNFDDGPIAAQTFFTGGPATWAFIRNHGDAPRDLTDPILSELLVDPVEEPSTRTPKASRFILVTGYAGAGKSTLLKRLAWDLANNWSKPTLWCRNPTLLQFDLVESLANMIGDRLYVFVDDAADGSEQVIDVIRRSKVRSLRVSFIIADRENEWSDATRENPMDPSRHYRLGRISAEEANAILDKLHEYKAEGALSGLGRAEQIRLLMERARRELLVGLREATEDGRRFDEIVLDEYLNIPASIARSAYLTICTLFQFDIPVRAGILSRMTGVPISEIGPKILTPAEGVILGHEGLAGRQPTYSARHSVIAEIVFSRALPTVNERIHQIVATLRQLDPGYRDDARAFSHLINASWLRKVGIEGERAGEIYELARKLRPQDPFVIQHEALSYRHSQPDKALRLMQGAFESAPNIDSIAHSRALLLSDQARRTTGDRRKSLLQSSVSEFERLIRRDLRNSASYVSLARLFLDEAYNTNDEDEKIVYLSRAQRIVSDAIARCQLDQHLLATKARIEETAGSLSIAIDAYNKAAERAGADPSFWVHYMAFLSRHASAETQRQEIGKALDINPTEPTINYLYALVLQKITPQNEAAIIRAFEYATAEPVRTYEPELDFAIFLHENGRIDEAEEHFQMLRNADVPYSIKSKPRKWLLANGENRRVFTGTMIQIGSVNSYLSVPSVGDRVYIATSDVPGDTQRWGAKLKIWLFYNAYGLRAEPALDVEGETGLGGK